MISLNLIQIICAVSLAALSERGNAFAPSYLPPTSSTALFNSRRDFVVSSVAAAGVLAVPRSAAAVDTEAFLKSGQVAMPMGVSGQAGKAKPRTGVVLREGTDVSRDERSGAVLAEILLGTEADPTPVLVAFSSPWSLAKGGLFDVECRDAKTGDGAFLTVAPAKGKSVSDVPKTFFTEFLFSPTGRFSFYGAPTDIKVKKSEVEGSYRYLELVFSNLSQSTNAEIPRTALVAATIPEGTDSVVMLVSSSTSNRWKRGSEKLVRDTVGTFKATLAPKSSMKVRAKRDRSSEIF